MRCPLPLGPRWQGRSTRNRETAAGRYPRRRSSLAETFRRRLLREPLDRPPELIRFSGHSALPAEQELSGPSYPS